MTKELGGPTSRSKEQQWLDALDDRVFWRWWLRTDAEDLRDFAEDVLRNETTCFDELAQPLFPKPSKRPKLP